MKVLHITNNYPTPNFPIFGIFVKEQIDSLSALGVENEVFFINGREKGKLEYVKSIFRLRKFLKGQQYDIVHCHHSLSAICLILSGKYKRYKTIVSYQSNPLNEQGTQLYEFIRRKLRYVILKCALPIIDNKNIFYQPNGVDINFFSVYEKEDCLLKLNLNKDKQYILFVSSNYVRKEKRYDKFQLLLRILRNKYNLEDIEELKLVNTERSLVPYYFNAASLHLLTSDFEGSPNSVKEAMACNTPVVSTNVGNVDELLSNVEGSFVSRTSDVDELADLAYKALTFQGQQNGREVLIKQELDMESVARKIIKIYNQL